jgi:hypothetical protein
MSIDKNDLQALIGAAAVGADGDKIGDVSHIYLSDTTGEPTWATVKTGLFGTHESFVPLSGSSAQPGELHVAFDKATVKDAPRVDADGHLTPEEEDDLYRYYGITDDNDSRVRGTNESDDQALQHTETVGDPDPDPGRDQDADLSRPDDREESSRSEADSDTDLDAVTPGQTRTRMRRYVVTEHVTQTVEELPEDNERA